MVLVGLLALAGAVLPLIRRARPIPELVAGVLAHRDQARRLVGRAQLLRSDLVAVQERAAGTRQRLTETGVEGGSARCRR